MSILDRLNLLIRSEISDLTRKEGSPMRELDSSLREARRQKAELRRSEAHLVRQIRDTRDKAARWEDRAMLALKSGDEDLAREALVMKNRAIDEANRLRDELDDYRAQIQDLERALEALEMKLEGARGRLENTYPRSSGRRVPRTDEAKWDAEMRRRRRESPSSPPERSGGDYLDPIGDVDDFGTSRSFEEFDRMSSKINAIEADIEAMRELADPDDIIDPRRRELEDIFSRMEKRKRTDDDLSDLKKKFE